jgi:hypothetical protein
MIIIHPKQILIFTPNKCASTTVISALKENLKDDFGLVLGPQGPWKEYGIDNVKDSVGKHSVVTPFEARTYKKYLLYRNPFDRFVSLWKHYCKYTSHEVDFSTFVGMVEKWKIDKNHAMWFYTWRMDEIVKEAGYHVGLIHTTRINEDLNKALGTEIEFPTLHATVHEPWHTYYTPELYRRVLELA